MPTNLFSTYTGGENRVTASMLAVLQSLSLQRIERLLGALLEKSEFELVQFENQPSRGGEGVPDAAIVSSVRILVETKTVRNAVRVPQLSRHLMRLDQASEAFRMLLVLTPDDHVPAAVAEAGSSRIAWASFAALDQAIDELLSDTREVVSEREAFLLRELQAMLVRERLLATDKSVVVVAARDAWPEYQKYAAYVCQPERPFQAVQRIAFYSDGQVHRLVPKILEVFDTVEFVSPTNPPALNDLVRQLLADTPRQEGQQYKVMLLSAPDSPDTLTLASAIPNDLTSATGRTSAFTQNQRYVSLQRLQDARTTSQLVDEETRGKRAI